VPIKLTTYNKQYFLEIYRLKETGIGIINMTNLDIGQCKKLTGNSENNYVHN